MEKGDIVVFLKPTTNYLTNEKQYEVLNISGNVIEVRTDRGYTFYYDKSQFIILNEWRKSKIDNFLE